MRWRPAITEVRLGALAALLTTAAYLVLIETAPLRILEGQALDLRFQLRGPLEPVGDIAIVQIDDRSIAEIGRWPWPRTRFAEAVDRLKEAGAADHRIRPVVYRGPGHRRGRLPQKGAQGPEGAR